MRPGAGLDFFRVFSLPWWLPGPGERAGGQSVPPSLPKTLAVIGRPSYSSQASVHCFLERAESDSCMALPVLPSQLPGPAVRRHCGHYR